MHSSRVVKPSFAFGVFATHKMATAGFFMLYFARGSNFNSFFQPFMGFLFRHLINPLNNFSNWENIKLSNLRYLLDLVKIYLEKS